MYACLFVSGTKLLMPRHSDMLNANELVVEIIPVFFASMPPRSWTRVVLSPCIAYNEHHVSIPAGLHDGREDAHTQHQLTQHRHPHRRWVVHPQSLAARTDRVLPWASAPDLGTMACKVRGSWTTRRRSHDNVDVLLFSIVLLYDYFPAHRHRRHIMSRHKLMTSREVLFHCHYNLSRPLYNAPWQRTGIRLRIKSTALGLQD